MNVDFNELKSRFAGPPTRMATNETHATGEVIGFGRMACRWMLVISDDRLARGESIREFTAESLDRRAGFALIADDLDDPIGVSGGRLEPIYERDVDLIMISRRDF